MPQETMLTKRQEAIILAIREYTQANGYPPNLRELGDAVGLRSTSSIDYQLCQLEGLGLVSRKPNAARTLRVIAPAC